MGANIGYFSVLASGLVGPDGRVIAVEPDARNRAFLEANLQRNGFRNVVILPFAAWSEEGSLILEAHPAGGSMSSVRPADEEEIGAANLVPARRLDEIVDEPVDLMKIDCELADHKALLGAAGLLRANPSMVTTVELARNRIGPTGQSPELIVSIYERLGLRAYRIRSTGWLKPIPFSLLLGNGRDPEVHFGRMGGPGEDDAFNFALSLDAPRRLIRGFDPKDDVVSYERRVQFVDSVLRFGGNLIERLPERIRPRVRRRDRLARLRAESGKRSEP